MQYSTKNKDNQAKNLMKNSKYIFRANKTYSSPVQRDNATRTELRIPNTTDQKIGQVHFQKARLIPSAMISQNQQPKWNENRATKSGRNKIFTKEKKNVFVRITKLDNILENLKI